MTTSFLDVTLGAKFEQRGLSTIQLEQNMQLLLRHVAEVANHNQSAPIDFLGVFPFDLFPLETFLETSPSRAMCCIVNSDPSNKPGTHWIAFFMDKANQIRNNIPILEFFDSYGLPPSAYSFKPISPTVCTVISNKYTLQSYSSNVCGHYCLMYLYLRTLISYSSNIQSLEAHSHVVDALCRLGPNPPQRDKNVKLVLGKLISRSNNHSFSFSSFSSISQSTSLISNTLHNHTIQSCTPFSKH